MLKAIKPITANGTFSPEEWEETVLPLAESALESMRERGIRIPKRISKASLLRLALGLQPAKWGNGDRLVGHRPHERRKDKDQQ
jgi:hypothetical protein